MDLREALFSGFHLSSLHILPLEMQKHFQEYYDKSEVKWNKMGLHSLSYQDHLMDEP